MPSIAVRKETQSISAATAVGLLTVTSTADLYSDANAWVSTNNGATTARVKIIKIVSTTTLLVRKYPTRKNADGTSYPDETAPPPSYGFSDMTAFNGTSFISMEAQSVPVDPAFSKRPAL